jgi:hypothetical protein
MSLIDWSRGQFALTAIYHWIFVPLTLGLSFAKPCVGFQPPPPKQTLEYKKKGCRCNPCCTSLNSFAD